MIFEKPNKEKNEENIRLHGVSLYFAEKVFEDPNYDEVVNNTDYSETRWLTRGFIGNDLLIVWTAECKYDSKLIKIIGARWGKPKDVRKHLKKIYGV